MWFDQKYKNKQYLIINFSIKLLLVKSNYNINNKKLLIIVALFKV